MLKEVLSRGRSTKYSFDAVLHPESFYYETRGATPGMVEDKRRYTFEDSPGVGTKVRADADYKLMRGGLRFLDVFGLVNRQMKGMEDRLLGAFLAEAEDRLNSSTGSPAQGVPAVSNKPSEAAKIRKV
jgi:hypothetical protein